MKQLLDKFMRGIRFWFISIVSFITVTVGTIFFPGSFLNRFILVTSCTVFGFNSAFCTPNLGIDSDRAMATSTSTPEKMQGVYRDLSKQESVDIEKQRDSILAFAPDETGQGHRLITEFSLQGVWMTPDKKILTDEDGTKLGFTKEAIEEIYQANRGVDLKPGADPSLFSWANWKKGMILPFSQDFYISKKHFDNELFPEASCRLKRFIKKDVDCIYNEIGDGIVDILKTITKDSSEDTKAQAGKDARKKLGQALHTLQDFYAHTNWVELGFKSDEIDERLGRSIIPAPPENLYTSEPVSQLEIEAALAAQVAVKAGSLIPGIYGKIASIVGKGSLLQHTPEELASSQSTKPGILNPKFKGTRNKNFLTSGYFMGVGPIDSCKVPKKGKTRHGVEYLCPNGLNKDEEGRDGYGIAQAQAVKATIDYINQIIYEDPSIRSNIPAIKALMGIRTPPKEDPCKSEENKNSEKCKLKESTSWGDPHLATFDGLKYDLQTVGEVILTKSNDGAFEVQARQAPYSSSMSINSAAAVKVGSDRVALYAREFPDADTSTPLRVNGKPTAIQGDKLDLPGGGQILKQGSTYVISSPRGEKVLVSQSGAGNTAVLNISPFVYNQAEKYSGLLGNVNGNPNDDLQIRGGNNILEVRSTYGDVNQVLNLVGLRLPGALDAAEKVYFDQLYKKFANSWRVKQEESLFDYPPGKTTDNYTDTSFPDKYLTLNMLSAEQIQKARNACTEAKVTEDLMASCIFDVGFSGFSEFARTAAEINGYISMVNKLFPGLNIPTPQQAVNRFIERVRRRGCFGPFCL